MGQKDILGYSSDIKEKQIIAARNAALDLGSGKLALVQSFQGTYGHAVQPMYEVGSSAMYLVSGQPQGTFDFTSLVGTSGWFAILDDISSTACGTLKSITSTLGHENDCDPVVTISDTIKFESALLRGISFSVRAGDLSIINGGQFLCGKLLPL